MGVDRTLVSLLKSLCVTVSCVVNAVKLYVKPRGGRLHSTLLYSALLYSTLPYPILLYSFWVGEQKAKRHRDSWPHVKTLCKTIDAIPLVAPNSTKTI